MHGFLTQIFHLFFFSQTDDGVDAETFSPDFLNKLNFTFASFGNFSQTGHSTHFHLVILPETYSYILALIYFTCFTVPPPAGGGLPWLVRGLPVSAALVPVPSCAGLEGSFSSLRKKTEDGTNKDRNRDRND